MECISHDRMNVLVGRLALSGGLLWTQLSLSTLLPGGRAGVHNSREVIIAKTMRYHTDKPTDRQTEQKNRAEQNRTEKNRRETQTSRQASRQTLRQPRPRNSRRSTAIGLMLQHSKNMTGLSGQRQRQRQTERQTGRQKQQETHGRTVRKERQSCLYRTQDACPQTYCL